MAKFPMAKYRRVSGGAPAGAPPTRIWLPWPIRTPSLAAFAALCIAICICIELIVHGCSKTGCRIFGAPSTIQVSLLANFLYHFLPTVLSVSFSLLWAVVHHDVMRLEPYIQMSSPGGAVAKDSILLDYPYMFPLRTPYIAWKRKHYVVFLSSCILLVTNFLITPLTSGLFDDANLTKYINSTATRGAVKPGNAYYTPCFSYIPYNYHWGSGTLPTFTSPTYALLPVKPGSMVIGDNETWRAETTLFEAELACEPAVITNITHSKFGKIGLNITSLSDSRLMSYLWDISMVYDNNITDEYTDSVSNDGRLGESIFVTPWTSAVRPSRGFLDNHLFLWGSAAPLSTAGMPGLPRNLTALYCTASYYSQSVIANLSIPSCNITSMNRTGVRTPFTKGAGFISIFNGSREGLPNSLADIRIIGNGPKPMLLPNIDSQLRRQLGPRPESLERFFFDPEGIQSNSSVFMGNVFTLPAFSLHNQTTETLVDLLDPKVLRDTYDRELKLLFALAVAMNLVDSNATEEVTVMREVYTRGFKVRDLWARGAQGGLAVVAVMAVVLGIKNRQRHCMLDREPNSLAAALQLLAASPEMCAEFENAEFYMQEELRNVLIRGGRRYKLVLIPGHGPRIHVVTVGSMTMGLLPPDDTGGACIETRLWALRTSSGVGLVMFFSLVTALLMVVSGITHTQNGLPTLGGVNSFGYKVLFSYLPFVIGSAVEPVLVGIGSCYCMLGPYETLRRRRRNNPLRGKPLTTDYDKSPPHFQLLRSLRTGDYPLAALTVSILLASVLSVALGVLFSPISAEFTINVDVENPGPPTVKGGFIEPTTQMFYELSANISDGNSAPSWTTPEYYVIPFSSVSPGALQAPTVGIGVDIKCSVLSDDSLIPICITYDNGTKECTPADDNWHFQGMNFSDGCFGTETNSTESIRLGTDKIFISPLCHDTFFVTWTGSTSDDVDINNYRSQAVILKCTATDRVHKVTVSINEANQVLSTSILPPDNEKIEALYLANSSLDTLTWSFLQGLQATQSGPIGLLQWLNYLLVVLTPTIMLCPTEETWCLPDPAEVVAPFEDLYRRLFAINLKLYEEDIFSFGTPYSTSGTAIVKRERVKMNIEMTIVALIILLYTTVVLVVLYLWKRPQDLQHVPVSLAGMYALLYASNAKSQTLGRTPEERAEKLDGRYCVGDFKGGDGRKHFGVYREDGESVSPPE